MTWFVVLGALAAVAGAVLLGIGIAHHAERQPIYVAMLIGGMMLTAFGIILAGFAVAYHRAAPLDLNGAVP